jgi:hypothetical protein
MEERRTKRKNLRMRRRRYKGIKENKNKEMREVGWTRNKREKYETEVVVRKF